MPMPPRRRRSQRETLLLLSHHKSIKHADGVFSFDYDGDIRWYIDQSHMAHASIQNSVGFATREDAIAHMKWYNGLKFLKNKS